jgi:hypothetical protein
LSLLSLPALVIVGRMLIAAAPVHVEDPESGRGLGVVLNPTDDAVRFPDLVVAVSHAEEVGGLHPRVGDPGGAVHVGVLEHFVILLKKLKKNSRGVK